ncbi:response regulator [Paenibacillus puldeungensis]|uniref:Response regulator n=1 Tax=Paenibacillus puldeungensis TaxID=696536 RepID=A0ABW3RRQ4_9BACL
MVRAIVVDDEWYNLEETSEYIEQTSLFEVAGKYQNPLKALEEAAKLSPAVAFIDIELPEMDGITLAEKLLELHSSMIIVFITSYNQYAVQAFDLNAIDYILKPIKRERFNRMVEKIKNELGVSTRNTIHTLNMKCFSALNVAIGDNLVKWERAKAEELFAYLLMHHGSYIHKEKIIEELWPGYEPEKALQILQTSVCKIRNLFASIKNILHLDYSSSRYGLFVDGGECDLFQVEEALHRFKASEASTYAAVEEASVLYGKGFLAEEGYLWAVEKDRQLQESIVTALHDISNFYDEEGIIDKAIKVLKMVVKLAPYDEEANCRMIKLYLESGDMQAALQHYEWLENILSKEYDTAPSEKIRALLTH